MISLLGIFACIEVIVGLALLPTREAVEFPLLSPPVPLAIQIVTYGGIGALLSLSSNSTQTRLLGSVFLIIASTFALGSAASSSLTSWILRLPLDAFLPYVLWRFACHFPDRSNLNLGALDPFIGRVLCAIGWLLLLANALPELTPYADLFDRTSTDSLYPRFVYPLLIVGLVAMGWRGWKADPDERSRVRFFLLGLFGPALVLALLPALTLLPTFDALLTGDDGRLVAIPVLHTVLIAIPLLTTYAVVANRGLQSNIIRNVTVKYWIARSTSWFLIIVPTVVSVSLLWTQRSSSIQNLVTSLPGLLIGTFSMLALAAFGLRERITSAVNKTFFREDFDAVGEVVSLHRNIRTAESLAHIGQELAEHINRTLHVEHVHLLVKSAESWIDPRGVVRFLPLNAPLFWHLEDSPLTAADIEDKLDEEALAWLVDARTNLLLPLNSSDNRLLAVLSLSQKESGLPYSAADLDFLMTALNVGGAVIEARTSSHNTPAQPEFSPAYACNGCGEITTEYTTLCGTCGTELLPLNLPSVISGRYQMQKQIGSGSMGIAILAIDAELNRQVVLKTLPQVQRSKVNALREEARTMAQLQHTHLTAIYDVESWQGVPILVMEYLAGGTLEQHHTLTTKEAVMLGIEMFSAITLLHQNNILHRDIKPSNIGFDANGQSKLLDFGFAQSPENDSPMRSYLAGTPKYLPPEIFSGVEPGTMRDIWALSLTLYEALAGQLPFATGDLTSTMRGIISDEIPLLSSYRPDCAPLDDFFSSALEKSPGGRPQSAKQAKEMLEGVLENI